MSEEQINLLRDLYKRYKQGLPKGEHLMTIFYRDVCKNHDDEEIRNLEMHQVFSALLDGNTEV